MGELADLLMSMREARDDMLDKKNAEKNGLRRRNEEEKQAGKRIVEAAVVGKSTNQVNATDVDVEDDGGSRQSTRKKIRRV